MTPSEQIADARKQLNECRLQKAILQERMEFLTDRIAQLDALLGGVQLALALSEPQPGVRSPGPEGFDANGSPV